MHSICHFSKSKLLEMIEKTTSKNLSLGKLDFTFAVLCGKLKLILRNDLLTMHYNCANVVLYAL